MGLTPHQEAWWQERRRAAKAAAQPWQTYPWSPNRWRHFTPYELRSRGDGRLYVDVDAMDGLQGIRVEWDRPMIITSAYRTAEWNAAVGGSLRSIHKLGLAYDVAIPAGPLQDAFVELCLRRGVPALGRYRTFVHVDWRPWKARWDRR